MKNHYYIFRVLLLSLFCIVTSISWAETITTSDGLQFEIYESNVSASLVGYTGSGTSVTVPTSIDVNGSMYKVTQIQWTNTNSTITTLDISQFNENNISFDGGIYNGFCLLNQASNFVGLTKLRTIYVDYNTYNLYVNEYNSNVSDFKCQFAETASVSLDYTPDYQVSGKFRYQTQFNEISQTTMCYIVGFEDLGNNASVTIPEKINGNYVAGITLTRNSDNQMSDNIEKLSFDGFMKENRSESGFIIEEIITESLPSLKEVHFSNYSDYERYGSYFIGIENITYDVTQREDGAKYALAYECDYNDETGLFALIDKSYVMTGLSIDADTVVTLISKIGDIKVSGIIDSEDYQKLRTLIVDGDYEQYFPTEFDNYWEGYYGLINIVALYCDLDSYSKFAQYGARLIGHSYNGFPQIYAHDDNIFYALSGDMVSVVGFTNNANEVVTIPQKIEIDNNDYFVNDIMSLSVPANSNVTKLILEDNIEIYGTLSAIAPNLKEISAPYYYTISMLIGMWNEREYMEAESIFYGYTDDINFNYNGKTYEYNDIKVGDYNTDARVWIGFSDSAEDYVTVNNTIDGEVIFRYVGQIEPSKKVTHLKVDMSTEYEILNGAYSKLTNLEGLWLTDDIYYDNYDSYLPKEVPLFGDANSMMQGHTPFYEISNDNGYIVSEEDNYALNGLVITGSMDEGFTVIGYNGELSGIDLSDAMVKYHGWDVNIRQIDALANTNGNVASTLKLVVLPCNMNIWVNGQALYNMTGTGVGSHMVEEEPIVSLIHNCEEELDLSNSMQLLDNAALIFVATDMVDYYKDKYSTYADKFVDVAIISSQDNNVVYDSETNTLEVAVDNETNIEQLANIVNSGAAITEVMLIKLIEDIDLTDENSSQKWTMLGTEEVPFNGSFDGQGNTIILNDGENQANVTSIFGTIGDEGTIDNVNIEGVNYEAQNSEGREMQGDDCEDGEKKHYYPLLVGVNNGVLSNVVVTGSVQIEEADEANAVACVVAENYGEIDHVVGYFEGVEDATDGNKRCILVSQNIGVGRNAGKSSKMCSNTKSQKRLSLEDAIPFDVDDDIRYYTNTEMANGEPAYWLNFDDRGYTGTYTREWSMGTKYPVTVSKNQNPVVKIIYDIDGATAQEVGLKNPVYYANEGSVITIETKKAPGQVIVNGEKKNNLSTKMTITLNGLASANGTIVVNLRYGSAVGVSDISANEKLAISAVGRQITIKNAQNNEYSIFNIRGAEVAHGTIDGATKQILIPEIGVYVVKVGDSTQKVIIR